MLPSPPSKIRSILLIDDDPEELLILQDAVSFIDPLVQVRHVKDYSAFLLQMRASAPDIVFLDINIPHQSGLSLIKQIRAAGYTLPIVMYSTTTNEQTINEAYLLGANLFLSKPMSFKGLLQAFQSILQLNWERPQEIALLFFRYGKYHALTCA